MDKWPAGKLDRIIDNANYTCQSTGNLVSPQGVSSTTYFRVECKILKHKSHWDIKSLRGTYNISFKYCPNWFETDSKPSLWLKKNDFKTAFYVEFWPFNRVFYYPNLKQIRQKTLKYLIGLSLWTRVLQAARYCAQQRPTRKPITCGSTPTRSLPQTTCCSLIKGYLETKLENTLA